MEVSSEAPSRPLNRDSSLAVSAGLPQLMRLDVGSTYFFLIFYFIHERYRGRGRDIAEEETGSLREPDAGLDPRTPGSHPEPKADAQPPGHPGVPP